MMRFTRNTAIRNFRRNHLRDDKKAELGLPGEECAETLAGGNHHI